MVPSNAYRDVVEIYVLSHLNDEFWYSNPLDAYIEPNSLTTSSGNGAFREVVSFIDGVVVGVVWPFPIVFTGGNKPSVLGTYCGHQRFRSTCIQP